MENKDLVKVAEQAVTYDLIKIENGTPVAVTGYLDEYVNALKEYKSDSIENDIDVDVVNEKIKQAKDTFKGIKTFRLAFTNPLKDITSEFTSREKEITLTISEWEASRDKMLEQTFKIAEEAIKEELARLYSENIDLNINMHSFDSFVEVQRKVKGMLPSEKTGKLSKPSLKKIEETFNKVADPIREAKKLEEQKQRETAQFDNSLPNIHTNDIEELEIAKLEYMKIQEQVDTLYPHIKDSANNTIKNRLNTIEASLNALRRAEKAEAKAKADREALEALKGADEGLMQEVEIIKNGLENIKSEKELLIAEKQKMTDMWHKVKYSENKKIIGELGSMVAKMIEELEVKEAEEALFIDTSTPFDDIEEVEEKKKKIYSLSDIADVAMVQMDLEMLAVEADNEEDAIKALVEAFEKSLNDNRKV